MPGLGQGLTQIFGIKKKNPYLYVSVKICPPSGRRVCGTISTVGKKRPSFLKTYAHAPVDLIMSLLQERHSKKG